MYTQRQLLYEMDWISNQYEISILSIFIKKYSKFEFWMSK